MSKNSKKKKSKQTDVTATTDESEVAAERPLPDPVDRFGGWFDRWPSMFNDLRLGLAEPFGVEPMRIEEYVDDDTDESVIRVEIPGVDPETDIDISLAAGRLTVSAKREEQSTKDGKRSEFRYGSFRRTMTVPASVEAEDVTATYDDGILEIRIPVAGEEEARTKVAVTRR